MNHEDETRFEAAFADLGDAAELMVEPPEAGVIRRRVRRRRTARVSIAAVAALALLAPATWMLQQAATAEEQRPPAADDTTVETTAEEAPSTPEAPATSAETTPDTETETAEPPPGYDDLLGQSLDLPGFGDSTEGICPSAPARLTALGGDGPIHLIKVVHARLTADGPLQAVALVGCRPGEAMIRQVLVIEADGDGYAVAEQLYRYEFEENGSVYDIAPDAEYGVLFGLIESEPCCSTLPEDLDQWIDRYRDGGFTTLSGAVPGTYATDLEPAVEVVDAGQDTWEVTVTVTNVGGGDSAPFELGFCSNDGLRLADVTTAACMDGGTVVETGDGLAAGETYEVVWTVTADPKETWDAEAVQYGQMFTIEVSVPRYGTDALVFETATGNDWQTHTIAYEAMD